MTKKIIILNNEKYQQIILAIKNYLSTNSNIEIELLDELPNTNENLPNLIILINAKDDIQLSDFKNCKIINLHFSILPALKTHNALIEAFKYGVKVSGISIHKVTENNFYDEIISQYPVLIGLTTHFDEYEKEIIQISSLLYPKVIESIINDKVFDFSELTNNHCSKSCNHSCNQCNK